MNVTVNRSAPTKKLRLTHTRVYDAAPEVLKFNLSIEEVSRDTRMETMFGLHAMPLQPNLKRRLQLMLWRYNDSHT